MALRLPKLCHHRGSGLAYVTDPRTRKEEYFGPWGSPEATAGYDRWVRAFVADGGLAAPRRGQSKTLAALGVLYLPVAEARYRKRGKPTAGYARIRRVLKCSLSAGIAGVPLDELAPRHLRVLARHLTEQGKCARTIDAYLSSLKVMARWGADREPPLVSEDTADRIDAVRGLGRKVNARVLPPILPPPSGAVQQAMPCLPRTARAIVELLGASGMRPGEACGLRVRDIDDTQDPWKVAVCDDWNKTAHRGKVRTVWLGPRARAILAPWLEAARRHGEDSPLFPTRCTRTRRGLGHYTSRTLERLIARAVEKSGCRHWHANQLRHQAATHVRAEMGPEAAQAMLGHDRISTSEIYAMPDSELARKTAEKLG